MAAGMSAFVDSHRSSWERLSAIVNRAGVRGRGIRELSRDDLKSIGPLYRRAASDLAFARMRAADPALIQYLNDLVIRAHGLLYVAENPGGARLWEFISRGFPRLLLARRLYVLLAAAVFLLGGVIGGGVTAHDPTAGHVFLGERAEDVDFYHDLPKNLQDGERPADSAQIMTNNIKVAVVAFALGIFGGVPTLYLLFANGLPIGSLAVLQHRAHYDVTLWSFLLPHGIPELTAIFIAGGAGMLIGHKLIAPGNLSRRDALRTAGNEAVRLLFGTVTLFVIAGITESFVSPTAAPAWFKFTYAALMAVALTAYVRRGIVKAAAFTQGVATARGGPIPIRP